MPTPLLEALSAAVNAYEATLMHFLDHYQVQESVTDEQKRAAAATTDTVESAFGVAGIFGKRSAMYSPFRIASLTVYMCNRNFTSGVTLTPEERRKCRKEARQAFLSQHDFAEENDAVTRKEGQLNTLESLYLSQLIDLAEKCKIDPPKQRAKKDILVELLSPHFDKLDSEIKSFVKENEQTRAKAKSEKKRKQNFVVFASDQPITKVKRTQIN